MTLIERIDGIVQQMPRVAPLERHRAAAEEIFDLLRPPDSAATILGYLRNAPLNGPMQVDPNGNPMQIAMARNWGWVFTMYLWLSEFSEPLTAHDHTSFGLSLIHTGPCYRERLYRFDNRALSLVRTHTCSPGEVRMIEPSTLHSVQPLGGISFNLWGPRVKEKTTVLDLSTHQISKQCSESGDAVRELFRRLEAHDKS